MKLSIAPADLVARAEALLAGVRALAERHPDATFHGNDLGNLAIEDESGAYIGYVGFRLGHPDVEIFDATIGEYVDLVPDIGPRQPTGETP